MLADSEIEPHVGWNTPDWFSPLGWLRRGPRPSKRVHSGWRMARVMVVHKGVDSDAPSLESAHDPNPLGQLGGPVNNGLVPDFCSFLNPFAIAQPPNVSEVGSNGIARVEDLVGARHPGMISQGKCHAVPPED